MRFLGRCRLGAMGQPRPNPSESDDGQLYEVDTSRWAEVNGLSLLLAA